MKVMMLIMLSQVMCEEIPSPNWLPGAELSFNRFVGRQECISNYLYAN